MKNEHKTFYKEVIENLHSNTLAILAGAGLSKGAGYVDWKGLLREIAEDLGLSVDLESDLISLAQYSENKLHGKSMLNKKIIQEFNQDIEVTENHKILARLPIQTYWTTNYDDLIEKSLKEASRWPNTKHAVSQLSLPLLNRGPIVYKMHGDSTLPNDAVLTKDDYERYHIDKQPFVTALSGDLVNKLFVFIGFSFTDPNLDYILSRVRLHMKGASRHHYYFIKKIKEDDSDIKDKADFEYKTKKQEHFISDLARFKLQPVVVDSYQEITNILSEIETLFKKKTIFIGGSAETYGAYDRLEAQTFIHKLSSELIRNNFRIVNGFGWGIGSAVINGALDRIHSRPDKYSEDQLIVRPFPQYKTGEKELKELWTDYRKRMLSFAGAAIYIFGNKLDHTGKEIIDADGLISEFNIAKEKNVFLLPIPATGFVSEKFFTQLMSEKYFEADPDIKMWVDKLAVERDLNKITEIIISILSIINK